MSIPKSKFRRMEGKLDIIKGIIFDLDGVLIDSYEAWQKLLNYALKNYGKKTISETEFQRFWGQGMEKDIEILLPEITLSQLQKFYEDNFQKFSNYIKVFPETEFVLKKLKEKGLKIAIASNSAPKILTFCIKEAGLEKYLDYFLGASDSLKGKPEPDILFKILEVLKLKKEEVLFVGDSPFDIEAGKRAGIKTVGIGIKGDKEIKNLKDLIYLIDLN